MRIEDCEFPENVLYDSEGFVWAREESGLVIVGITSILAAVAGKLATVRAKAVGMVYGRGEGIGSLESGRYFGVIRAPVRGTLVGVNEEVLRRPKLLSEYPYTDGWFARLQSVNWRDDREALLGYDAAKVRLEAQIASLRIRCFAAFPDYEMYEIGTECAAVLVKLNELLVKMEVGEIVHIVSDDWTAPIEADRWSAETNHPVIETRREGNLYHFLVRKAH